MAPRTILQILLALVVTGSFLATMPPGADCAPESWIDQLVHQVVQEKAAAKDQAAGPAYDRYLVQLDHVQKAMATGHTQAVQREMDRFVTMLATKQGDIPEASALSLLHFASRVTPRDFLGATTQEHLRLIDQLFVRKAEELEELPDTNFQTTQYLPDSRKREAGWMTGARLHPVAVLGAGLLLLISLGVLAMVVVALGVGQKWDRRNGGAHGAMHIPQRPDHHPLDRTKKESA